MTPLIGITTYGKNEKDRYTLPVEYVEAVRRAGGVPVLLPPDEPRAKDLLPRLDGVILAGGGDVDPSLYGGKPHEAIYMVDPGRDRSEAALVKEALKSKRPTFGICRGSQMMNVALGGTLMEHLPDEVGEKVPHRLPPREYSRHAVSVEAGSLLRKVLGRGSVEVASAHHQAVRRAAPRLKTVARAPDGVIEALELPGHPWMIGVQWHPEHTAGQDPLQQKLFDDFVKAAARFGKKRG